MGEGRDRPLRRSLAVADVAWSWRGTIPRPMGDDNTCYDHSRGCGLGGYRTAGSAAPKGSDPSFRIVSGLSHRQRSLPAVLHHFCCRAVADRPRAPLLVTMSHSHLVGLGGVSEVAFGASLGAPFNEPEQLGSQMRSSKPTSKPHQPRVKVRGQSTNYRLRCDSDRSVSRAMSRSAMAARLSCALRPRATAISTFARPSLK